MKKIQPLKSTGKTASWKLTIFSLMDDEPNIHMLLLTWPMAKRLKLFGITYLVGKSKVQTFYFRVHWLSESVCLLGYFCYRFDLYGEENH